MMMSPTVMDMNELSMKLQQADRKQDGLVPTTISEHTADFEDVGYHSDDKVFYDQLEKQEKISPNTSGMFAHLQIIYI